MALNRAWIAVAGGGIGLGVVAAWLATPSTEPVKEEIELASALHRPEPVRRTILPPMSPSPGPIGPVGGDEPRDGKARRGKGKGKARAGKAKGKAKAKAPPNRDDALPPDERAALRDEMRSEKIGMLAERLDSYAAEAGWDPETADRVAELMLATTDKISRNLERVDRGEVEWAEIRDPLRDYRLHQAARVRNLLGDEEFDKFVDGMDLVRFMGEKPIRGRLP